MPLTVIEPRRLYRQVAEQVRALIDRGEFPAGSRLPTERELAVKLGVSRPTVREALIALEVDGRVKIRVGSGIYVLPAPQRHRPSEIAPVAGPFEVLEARALIEGAVAGAAAAKATVQDIKALDDALALMRGTRHPGPESIAADRSFHVAIANIVGNDPVAEIVEKLFDQRVNPYFEQLARYFETPASWNVALDEHAAIRDAIARHDAAGAAAAMRAHLDASQQRFSKNFGPASPVGPAKSNEAEVDASKRRPRLGRRLEVPKSIRRKSAS